MTQDPTIAHAVAAPRGRTTLVALASLGLLAACSGPVSTTDPPDASQPDAPSMADVLASDAAPSVDVTSPTDVAAEDVVRGDDVTSPPDVATPTDRVTPPDAPTPMDVATAPDASTMDVATAPDVPRVDVPVFVDVVMAPDVPRVDVVTAPDVVPVDVPVVPRWTLHANPCPGINRADALHLDDDGTIWVGCGTGAEGAGLFRGSSDAASWSQLHGTPDDVLSVFRVDSIERGPDGALYVGGYDASTRTMALRVDTRTTPATVQNVLVGTTRSGTNFQLGTLRMRTDGTALAESLNGYDALWRPTSTIGVSAWTDVRTLWATDSSSRQILDLVTVGDRFVGCGSTIAANPYVYLPSRMTGDAPYRMTPLVLSTAFIGEMWGVAATTTRVVAVGEDQRNHRGKIFVSGADPTVASAWREVNLDDAAGTTGFTWSRGVCMRGDRIVVVGERQPLRSGTGLVVQSLDGGVTWSDLTPAGVSASVSKCVIRADGTLVVAGASGMVGIYR